MTLNGGTVSCAFNKFFDENIVDIKNSKLSRVIAKPVTVGPNVSLSRVRGILLGKKIKRVLVVKGKKPIGVITEKDVAKKIHSLGDRSVKSIKAGEFKPRVLFTLTRENSVQECARLMKKHRIGQVIILNKDGTLDGIVTKTDLIAILLTKETARIKISKIMSKRLITAAPDDPILYVENLLLKYKISRIIVKQDRIPVGVITFRDFMPAKIPRWIAESADPGEVREYKFKKGLKESHPNQLGYLFPFHAADIMTANPITVGADKYVKHAITRMAKYGIGGLPVVKKSRLAGLITKSDIVNALAE